MTNCKRYEAAFSWRTMLRNLPATHAVRVSNANLCLTRTTRTAIVSLKSRGMTVRTDSQEKALTMLIAIEHLAKCAESYADNASFKRFERRLWLGLCVTLNMCATRTRRIMSTHDLRSKTE